MVEISPRIPSVRLLPIHSLRTFSRLSDLRLRAYELELYLPFLL